MKNKKLLFSITKKDLEITYFSGKGAGGQHRNRHMNCVRIRHPESGVIVTGQDERSKERNLKNAFKRLCNHPKFKKWLDLKIARESMDQHEIEEEINEYLKDIPEKDLKIEYL